MRAWSVALLAATTWTGAALAADPVATCQARQADVSSKVDQFSGDPMLKRVMQADLVRARRELIEGDADECMEALDHATKLLSGQN
jgi:hypothetical protein